MRGQGRTCAIAVGFDPERLALHQVLEGEAQTAVGGALAERGFSALLPGLYVGSGEGNVVGAVVAVQDLAGRFPWFTPCLRVARLLRIEEDGDLTIALK